MAGKFCCDCGRPLTAWACGSDHANARAEAGLEWDGEPSVASPASPGERGETLADAIDKITRERAEKAEAEVQRLTAERDETGATATVLAKAVLARDAEIASLRTALELQRSIADRWESVAQCGNEGAPCRTCDNQKRLIEEDESRLAALTPPAGTEPR